MRFQGDRLGTRRITEDRILLRPPTDNTGLFSLQATYKLVYYLYGTGTHNEEREPNQQDIKYRGLLPDHIHTIKALRND